MFNRVFVFSHTKNHMCFRVIHMTKENFGFTIVSLALQITLLSWLNVNYRARKKRYTYISAFLKVAHWLINQTGTKSWSTKFCPPNLPPTCHHVCYSSTDKWRRLLLHSPSNSAIFRTEQRQNVFSQFILFGNRYIDFRMLGRKYIKLDTYSVLIYQPNYL